MRTPSVRKKYVRNIDFFYDRIFMRTPYACIQDDDDSFLFLEAKNFCCSLLYCLAWCCRFCIPVLLASTLTGLYIQAQFFSLGSIIS